MEKPVQALLLDEPEGGRKAVTEDPTEWSPGLLSTCNQHALTYDWFKGFTTQGWGLPGALVQEALCKTPGARSPPLT